MVVVSVWGGGGARAHTAPRSFVTKEMISLATGPREPRGPSSTSWPQALSSAFSQAFLGSKAPACFCSIFFSVRGSPPPNPTPDAQAVLHLRGDPHPMASPPQRSGSCQSPGSCCSYR